jgi:Tc toxin complex TcA C-terminal TcB-binding domain
METINASFQSPTLNESVGEVISVTVIATAQSDVPKRSTKVTAVTVTFGPGGQVVSATQIGQQWSCSGTVSAAAPNGPLAITAEAEGTWADPPITSSEPGDSGVIPPVSVPPVVVNLTCPPPYMLVSGIPNSVTTAAPPFQLAVSGTAMPWTNSSIVKVSYQLNSAALVDDLNSKDVAGLWPWSFQILLSAGSNTLVFTATDSHGSKYVSQTYTVVVETPIKVTPACQAFEPIGYLRELLDFASKQIIVPTNPPSGPTAQSLAQQFFQPFDALTVIRQSNDPVYQQAGAPIHQARIAIEVLRQQLKTGTPPVTVPSDTDQRYRLLAYQAILRQLGTSYEELRLARVAAPAARTALAARLGIQIGTARPDNLDQITLLSTAITDSALESLFGYLSTSPADPLAPAITQPTFLLWQLLALRSLWQSQDSLLRDAASGALPLIDPDVIGAANFTNQIASNPAFALWTTRTNWVNTTLAQITQDGAAQTAPPTLFNQLVLKYVGNIAIADLASTDANGGDISDALATYFLDLDAFRFLALSLQLLSAGALLDSEWQDIFAILLETQKRQQFRQWRAQETQAGLVLESEQFQPNAGKPPQDIPQWRGSSDTYSDWQRTLEGRIAQGQTLQSNLAAAVASAESQTLPALRDALVQLAGQQQTPPETLSATAERLSRQLQIDFLTNAGPATTRVNQAIDTLQGILFSVRAGNVTTSGTAWTLNSSASPAFDDAWVSMGTFNGWLAAIKVFAYPQNQLSPNLYVADAPFLTPKPCFITLISTLRNQPTFTLDDARTAASNYLTAANLDSDWVSFLAPQLTDRSSDQDLLKRQASWKALSNPSGLPTPPGTFSLTGTDYELFEALWLVPIAIGQRLQSGRQYLAALEWFRTVYAYNLPQGDRNIYYPLVFEANTTTAYVRDPLWLTTRLNPHIFVQPSMTQSAFEGRKNAYTSYTIQTIVQCLLEYADFEFSNGSPESISEARSLYETAVDLLQSPPDISSSPDPNDPYPPNPIWAPLLSHAQTNLVKIRNGMNIAGALVPNGSATVFLPSQYPYSVLVNRAKNWVGIAQQVESSYLSALEQRDAATYSALQANNDIQVAAASLTLAQLKVNDAIDAVTAAQLQQNKAGVQYNYYDQLVSQGLNTYEQARLAAMETSLFAASLSNFGVDDILDPGKSIAETASAAGELANAEAVYERRNDEWQFDKNLADQDVQIAGQQIVVALDQQAISIQEQTIAGLQLSNATEVLNFLSNKFTNAELFDWMSGVLGKVYAYFLQQTTALAQVAEAQLAFERQTPPSGYIRSDYWQDTSESSDGTNRQGLTGAEQLLEDINQLDEYAFESDVRTLHLTQTLSVAQIASLELQQLRETGVLVLATPMSLFDQDFPGHYLRLIQSVQVSIIALVPPIRGVRGTLSTSGLSRVIVPSGVQFQSVTLGRAPESFSFTSATNANGLFNQETDTSGLLLPFQGMGVDTVWQLELPKVANPFDFRTISDVQLTIQYTALNSYDYREEVIRNLDSTFSGDYTFSIRDDFPDAWYLLNNPQTVADAASQMKVTLTALREDFQPNIDALAIQQITLFCLRQDGVNQEINILSLAHTPVGGQSTSSTAAVQTISGIVGTRRPAGAPWQVMIGEDPVGDWTLQFENTAPVQALFANGSIQDVALVLTVSAVYPVWP